MEGIAALAARVSQIEQLVTGMSSAAVTGASGTTSTAAGAAFASVLEEQVGAGTSTSTSTLSAADLAPSGETRINGDPLPVALAGHENGRLPEAAVSAVGDTGHRLFEPAARQLEKLLAAAQAQGVDIGITDSYRTYETQVDLVRRKGLYSQGGLAAAPGTSDHGWGMAVDLDLDAKAQAWMRQNAGAYGFAEDTPREPWHWAFQT
ncbi:M15 family metallopeptidase [Cellulomonas oligotrophica]|uniref:D-alanyl-D-alanine carboxypeptidase-like core domain-containing protein n=1 Tax=Cellulomonas oligotrophica TaxID=931536 RepID=A0A7Y9FJN1_9CELL|nr:M15 family metallopeptidase [Cellulomonas oligotrophica]NYD87256.1 hypothetical protein [Cellulomonas oligotrophica]GIG34038.1 hypothetical protein Col01nite_31970 [Cellulomonas oligotrophica]